jgi:16S rRNA processing protein RimM
MSPEPFAPIGRVVKTHGLKGELAIEPASGFEFNPPDGLEVWFVPPPRSVRSGRVEGVRRGPRGPLIKVSGIDDIGVAGTVVGTDIIARATDLPAEMLEPADVVEGGLGLAVTDVNRGLLGEVSDVIVTGANDVWVVDGPFGEVLLPVIDDVIVSIDWDAGTATVRLLPGLLAEEDAEL